MPEVPDIPDEETSIYLRKCLDVWSEIKSKYDSLMFNKTDWHFFKLRPQNFPTVRLAAGSRLLNRIINKDLFNRILKLFTDHSDTKKLIVQLRNEIIVKGEGYWATHFTFNKSTKTPLNYFIGIGRADEIIVNIILPIGLSFHTFQSLSYVIEVYRGNQKAEKHFGIYALYVMFYPQLVAGPIERPQNLLHQFREPHVLEYQRVTDYSVLKKLDRILWMTDF